MALSFLCEVYDNLVFMWMCCILCFISLDCHISIHRPAGLHLLLCRRTLAVSEAAASFAVLSPSRYLSCTCCLHGICYNLQLLLLLWTLLLVSVQRMPLSEDAWRSVWKPSSIRPRNLPSPRKCSTPMPRMLCCLKPSVSSFTTIGQRWPVHTIPEFAFGMNKVLICLSVSRSWHQQQWNTFWEFRGSRPAFDLIWSVLKFV